MTPSVHYDAEAQVLEMMWGDAPPTNGCEVFPGVVLRYTDAGQLAGATIYEVECGDMLVRGDN